MPPPSTPACCSGTVGKLAMDGVGSLNLLGHCPQGHRSGSHHSQLQTSTLDMRFSTFTLVLPTP
eukprot:6457902-Amphidinium_carterae.2